MGGLSAYASASTSSRPDTSWAGIAVTCFPSQEQASLQTRLPAPVQGTRSRVARLLGLEVTADSSPRRLSCASPNVATPDGSCDHGDNARVGFWLFLLWAVRPPSRSAGKAISTSDSLASSKLIRADGHITIWSRIPRN